MLRKIPTHLGLGYYDERNLIVSDINDFIRVYLMTMLEASGCTERLIMLDESHFELAAGVKKNL